MNAPPAPALKRTTFRTSRLLDFASAKELIAQTGHPEAQWPLVALKELVDNALDAAEEAGIAPHVTVTVDEDGIAVADNGPGLPTETLDGVLDFGVRVSSREAYVAPDRGAQGNALKTIIAMPFVLDGGRGHVAVEAHGQRHLISLTVDRIRQEPVIEHLVGPSDVRIGTLVRLQWPDAARSLLADRQGHFLQLARDYAVLNPHLTLVTDWFGERREIVATAPAWAKWRPHHPTSAHWYRHDHLERLVAAHLAHAAAEGREPTVRELVAEFRGLSGSAKQKAVVEAAGLRRARLRDLWDGGSDAMGSLLAAMQAQSRPVKPADLGVIGRDHLAGRLAAMGCEMESFDYRRAEGVEDGLPWVVEAAFGWLGEDAFCGRQLVSGVNWSPGIVNPFRQLGPYGGSLDAILGQQWAGRAEPVVLVLHLARPRVEYTARGKSAVVIGAAGGLAAKVVDLVTGVTTKWARQRKAELRRVSAEANRRFVFRRRRVTIKDAAWEVMESAYLQASANDTLPANARQIMYAARGYILKRTGGTELKDDYFTQTLLPDYMAETGVAWDVVFDARGNVTEPHTATRVPLGTLQVREYLGAITHHEVGDPAAVSISSAFPTKGPANRFGAALFIEKEGFDLILRAAHVAERFDIAVLSTKGLSVIACRHLIEQLGVPVFVLHDFDQAGFSILGTLRRSSRRYTFRRPVQVIDLGLTLTDIEHHKLEPEHQRLTQRPRTLRENGAKEADIAFLARDQRVELNMLSSDELVELIETKLAANVVTKVIPDPDLVVTAFRRACQVALLNRLIEEAAETTREQAAAIDVPDDMAGQVRAYLERNPKDPWDAAVADLANRALDSGVV